MLNKYTATRTSRSPVKLNKWNFFSVHAAALWTCPLFEFRERTWGLRGSGSDISTMSYCWNKTGPSWIPCGGHQAVRPGINRTLLSRMTLYSLSISYLRHGVKSPKSVQHEQHDLGVQGKSRLLKSKRFLFVMGFFFPLTSFSLRVDVLIVPCTALFIVFCCSWGRTMCSAAIVALFPAPLSLYNIAAT